MNENPTFLSKVGSLLKKLMEFLKPIWLKFWHWLKKINQRFQLVRWFIFLVLLLTLVTSTYYTIKVKTSNVGSLKDDLKTTTTLYDASAQKAGELYSQKGTFVELNEISPNIQNAVISTEDRTFYENKGFSVKGLARAFLGKIIGRYSGGGSTITQQLAKNALLTQEQTYRRKLEELFYAIEITKVFSKEDILAMYLNNAYFGNGVWGVQDASRRYFGKNASQLSLSEAATIAGMLKSPSYYNPIDHMDNAISRRNVVLGLMKDNGKINDTQLSQAKPTSLVLQDTYEQTDGYKYPYYFDAVVDEAINRYGLKEEDVMNKGLKIYTNLDQDYQKQMQGTFDADYLFPSNAADGTLVQASSVAVDPKTGGVKAIVGGRGEHVFRGYNRATQIKRQPGSSIKPLAVYAPALQAGYHYDSLLSDKEQSFGSNNYSPKNVDGTYQNEVAMYQAVAQSMNIPAVWLLDKIGVDKGVKSVENFGIDVDEKDENLALALGGLSTGVNSLQMAKAYTAFANNGNIVDQTSFITKIVDASGKVLVDNTQAKTHRVISENTAKEMTSMLLGVFQNGTGVSAQPYGSKVAGKTGSTEVPNDYGYGTKDQWIVGYTPDIVVSTWLGFDKTDKTHFMEGISESGVAPVFKSEMENILPYTAKTEFSQSSAQEMVTNNGLNGDSNNWFSDVGQNIQDGINSAGEKINEWYNDFKGLLGQ